MGIRLRKSFKLAPGVRMNLTGGGLSWTLGTPGASVGLGKRGTYLNSGLPGTGLYSRQRLSGGSSSAAKRTTSPLTTVSIAISVADDGTVEFRDTQGNPLPPKLLFLAKRQQRDVIRKLITEKCDEINRHMAGLENLHLYMPSAMQAPEYVPRDFEQAQPQEPSENKLGFVRRLFKSQRDRNAADNAQARSRFDAELRKWSAERSSFEAEECSRRELIEVGIYSDVEAMERFFEASLREIVWPRETIVDSEIFEGGRAVFLDVDLPEIEDMPRKTAKAPIKGYKLAVRDISPTALRRLYMRHIHSIAMRLIGEAFHAIPRAQEVVLSGYSQRAEGATGQMANEYLVSVKVMRDEWSQIDFTNLGSIDPVEAMAGFDLRRSMTKTGVFKPIEPFAP